MRAVKHKNLGLTLSENFLLYNRTAEQLYHEVARRLPIIDPHNHVDPGTLAQNKKFENLYQLWIKPDQYKSRIMRSLGVPERLISGDASDYEKFDAWSKCLPKTAGNPMLHWSCMELKALLGIDDMLTHQNAGEVWKFSNRVLQQQGFGAFDIVKKLGVEMLCTSDDLVDSLEHHLVLRKDSKGVACLPSLRGDTIVGVDRSTFEPWVGRLMNSTGRLVVDLETYQQAVVSRLDFFHNAGCLLSDHSFDSGFSFIPTTQADATMLFKKVREEGTLDNVDNIRLQSYLLHFLGKEYRRRGWKMQLHIGAQRYTSSRLRAAAGAAGGYACIGNSVDVKSLCLFLDGLDIEHALPKTILYTLNPSDNAVFASLTGSFSEDGVPGKIQFGPAWWFNDHHEGISQQLNSLSSYGLLSTSIGMTTDSRSVLSFLRHDYFRRILCNLIGAWAEEGKLPNDWRFLSGLVSDVSYNNCKNWLAN